MAHESFLASDNGPRTWYELLSNLVVPRPIAFVSTIDEIGVENIAPFSFFTVGGVNPPSIVFCPVLDKQGEKKTTLLNLETVRECVVNLVDRELAEAMNLAGGEFVGPRNKWEMAGLSPTPSLKVRPSRIAQSKVQLECMVYDIIEHGGGPGSAVYVICTVEAAHVHQSLLGEEPRPFIGLDSIARLGGLDYVDLENMPRFQMTRPTNIPPQK